METGLVGIFLTGLITGGLTCLAVQGGLLAATIAQREQVRLIDHVKRSGHAVPIVIFLIAKLIAYTLLGLLLGWLGSMVQMTLTVKVILMAFVAIFMLGTAMNLLHVHPIFRYFVIQPPKFLTRMVRKQSKSKEFFAPAFLGAFTVFVPCGTTQAMMALAIASGSPLWGSAIMFTFVLGTSPLFFILGYFATRLGSAMHQRFTVAAAVVLILLSFYTLFNAIILTGVTFGNSTQAVNNTVSENPVITIDQQGYTPGSIAVKAGSTVTLTVANTTGWGCQQAFTIPALGYDQVIPPKKSETITFTAPDKPTTIAFMCSMGMYRGVINVL